MKKRFILFILIMCISVCLIILLQREKKIKEYSIKENIELAIYLNDEKTNKIPQEGGNIFDETRSSCTNEAYIIWDYKTWSPIIKNMSEYKTKCELYFKTGYSEALLNGADPVLEEPLIPVTIDEDGTVKKADIGSEWYSYANKNWANAVLLFDESEDYLAGDTIPEDAIESYFVWIPKYRYQLWDLGNYDSLTEINENKVHEIPLIFGDYDTNDNKESECTTPMTSGSSGNCQIGDYMTHPAFLSIPSTGFWVGKFETGYNGATSSTEAVQNINDSSKIIIKPNVYSWRGIQIANAFYSSYNYHRELDSHMMKNTEWGAVAYLQHSSYGSATNIRLNNNSSYITGYQANEEPTCGISGSVHLECNIMCNDGTCNRAYPNSVLSSTTGNITGIYDMAGGSWEYVMGVVLDENGQPMSGRNSLYNSGFNGTFGCPTCDDDTQELTSLTTGYDFPDKKYYDTYIYATEYTQYQRRILGDATGEMGPFATSDFTSIGSPTTYVIGSWYLDGGTSINNRSPWYYRGAERIQGQYAGIFNFYNRDGRALVWTSFRIVLQ